MKNLKVKTKLLTGFLIVTALTLVVGAVSIISMNIVDGNYTDAIELHGKPLEDAGHSVADLHAVRAELRAAMLFTGDREKVQNQRTLVQGFLDDFEARTATYGESIVSADSRALFDEAMETYKSDFLPAVEKTLADAENGVTQATLVAYMVNTIKPAVDLVTENLSQCMTNKANNLDTTSAASTAMARVVFLILIALIVAATVISVILALYISRLISKPLGPLSEFMKQAGTSGDISLPPEKLEQLHEFGMRKDEIGQTISASAAFVDRISEVSTALGTIADNDLTVNITPLSDSDVLGVSLHKMVDSLNEMFSNINMSSSQVSAGASQVADGAQALAQGATQQAASIQELSSSISEIADRTKQSANMANKAARLADTIKGNAEKGSTQMDEMISSVRDINQSSQDIGKVIKVIDDIAFQTNILALNAAVEAARAGQHGKGFAVVAEEVRNLAAKSAEAAKDTESLIANSMEKAEFGVKIAGETATSLSEIVSGINESSKLVSEISTSSEEQSTAIMQVNTGIDQVAQVVQQNSATAEESAAASEEMSGQSAMLRELISQFRLKN